MAKLPSNKRFVFVILRGGMDGLGAIAPIGDKNYLKWRPDLGQARAVETKDWINIDGYFAFHPALKQLIKYYNNKDLAIIHAIASPYRGRSHFDAQDVLEKGVLETNNIQDGWLNRLLQVYKKDGLQADRMGLAIGEQVPLSFLGDINVASWQPVINDNQEFRNFMDNLIPLYKNYPHLSDSLKQARHIKQITLQTMANNQITYLDDSLDIYQDMQKDNDVFMTSKLPPRHRATMSPSNMKIVGQLLSREDGPRIAMFDSGGWDTHARQGMMFGALANRLTTLSQMLDILAQSMQDVWQDTVILVTTEFGRQVQENGSQGTDHGTGGVAFVMGGGINGGKIHGQWPGISKDELFETRDLMPTTDLRSVQKAILSQHLGFNMDDINKIILPYSQKVKPLKGLI